MQDLLKLMRTNSSVLAKPSRLQVTIPTDGESRHLSCAKLKINPFLRLTDLTARRCGRKSPFFLPSYAEMIRTLSLQSSKVYQLYIDLLDGQCACSLMLLEFAI